MPTTGTLSFAAAHWMINRVHGDTTDMRTLALPAFTAGLAQLLALMLRIANLSNARTTLSVKTTYFTGWQLYQHIFAFLCHQLCRSTGASYQLGALADTHLDIMYDGAQWNITHCQTVSCLDVHLLAGLDDVAHLDTDRGKDISLFAISIPEQCKIGRAVGIILNGGYPGGNICFIPFKINGPILSFVTAADMS